VVSIAEMPDVAECKYVWQRVGYTRMASVFLRITGLKPPWFMAFE
jgi:hypothetical protein